MKAVWMVLCLAVSHAFAAPTLVLVLGLGAQATPPYKLGEEHLPHRKPGLAVELLQQAAARCGVRLDFRLLPGERLLKALETGEINGAGLLSYTAERAQFAEYPLRDGKPDEARRLAMLSYVFYTQQDRQLDWDGHRLQGQMLPVGTNRGWSVNQDLAKLGITVEPADSVAQNFLKLRAGHIDAYATHEVLGDRYLAEHVAFRLVKLQPAIVTKAYYLLFSKQFVASHPQLASCMWRKIGSLRDAWYAKHMVDYID